MADPCRWCGEAHGAGCPKVKSIEFGLFGRVRRVEFFSSVDFGIRSPEAAAAEQPADGRYDKLPAMKGGG